MYISKENHYKGFEIGFYNVTVFTTKCNLSYTMILLF